MVAELNKCRESSGESATEDAAADVILRLTEHSRSAIAGFSIW